MNDFGAAPEEETPFSIVHSIRKVPENFQAYLGTTRIDERVGFPFDQRERGWFATEAASPLAVNLAIAKTVHTE